MNDVPDRDVEIFTEALRLPPGERAEYLQRACSSDGEMRCRVEALLQTHDQIGDFLEQPPQNTAIEARLGGSVGEKPGHRIGHFKLLQQIGEGGCGVVFMAEHEEPIRRRVALKIIKPGMDIWPQLLDIFPGQPVVERSSMNSWDDPGFRKDGSSRSAVRAETASRAEDSALNGSSTLTSKKRSDC